MRIHYTADIVTPLNVERLTRLKLENIDNKREAGMKKLEEKVEHQNNGKALLRAMNSKHKPSWLWTKRLKPGEKLRYIQDLPETLPTKVNKTRDINDINLKKCKR